MLRFPGKGQVADKGGINQLYVLQQYIDLAITERQYSELRVKHFCE